MLHNQRGSMLVISVFILVVMSALALTLSQLLSSSQSQVVTQVTGLRAQHAARSGVQNYLLKVFPAGQGIDVGACSGVIQQSFSADGLQQCSAKTQCAVDDYQLSDGVSHAYYVHITGTGICQSDHQVVSRTISIDGMEKH